MVEDCREEAGRGGSRDTRSPPLMRVIGHMTESGRSGSGSVFDRAHVNVWTKEVGLKGAICSLVCPFILYFILCNIHAAEAVLMALGVETPIANLRYAALKYYQPLFPDVLVAGPDDTPAVGRLSGLSVYVFEWRSTSGSVEQIESPGKLVGEMKRWGWLWGEPMTSSCRCRMLVSRQILKGFQNRVISRPKAQLRNLPAHQCL